MTYRCSLWGGSLAPLHVGFWATFDRIRKRQAQRFPAALPTLRPVAPGLWCGGKPDKRGLEQLQRRGIRRVIDLRTEREQPQHEAKQCRALGLEHLSFPMGESLPDFPQVVRLLECLDEAEHRPTYIHCREGKDRVGSVVALYRVTRQGWSLERAGAELLRNGFDTRLRTLAEDTAFYAATLRRPDLRQSFNRESKPALNPALTALLVLGLTTAALPAQAQFSFTNIEDTTTAAPVGSFSNFSPPQISGSKVAWSSIYNGGSPINGTGVFFSDNGIRTTISNTGNPAPIGTFTTVFGPVALSDSTVAFKGTYNGFSSGGIFTGSGGSLTTIAKPGDLAPTGTFTNLFNPSISSGTVAFAGDFNGGISNGIFRGNGGALTTIAKAGDTAPIGTFTQLDYPSISGTTVAFRATYNSGANSGIFTGSGGALAAVVKAGDTAPTGTFIDIQADTWSMTSNTLVFRGTYNSGSNSSIFTNTSGILTTIISTGDSAPVGTFGGFSGYSFSNNSVVFQGQYNHFINDGIFLRSGSTTDPVILKGASLFGSTVTSLNFSKGGYDGTNVAFNYSLADGRSGIAVATLSGGVAPEPGTLSLLALGAGACTLLARRRKTA